jgi:hypothetical protein
MGRTLFRCAFILWTLLTLILFVLGIPVGESRMTAELLMLFMGFPVNMLIPLISHYLPAWMAVYVFDVKGSLWQYIIEWSLMYLLGSAQWFLIPSFIFKKIQLKHKLLN